MNPHNPHNNTTPRLTLDTSATPDWDCTLLIRGVAVPTLSPLDAADRSIINLGERRRGALVRLYRWAFGEPKRRVDDDHETRELRHTVAAFVPPAHRRMLGAISGGELLAILGNYVGAQQAWYSRIERAARAEAERLFEEMTAKHTAPAPAVATHGVGGVQGRRVTTPPMKLVPGRPLPAITAGLVDDFRTGAPATPATAGGTG